MIASSETSRQVVGNFVVDTNEDNVVERYGATCIPRALAAAPPRQVWFGEIVSEDYDATHLDPARHEYVHYEGNPGVITFLPEDDYEPIEAYRSGSLRTTEELTADTPFSLDEDWTLARHQEWAQYNADDDKYEVVTSENPNLRFVAIAGSRLVDGNINPGRSDQAYFILTDEHPYRWDANRPGDDEASNYSGNRFAVITERWGVNSDSDLQSLWVISGYCIVRTFILNGLRGIQFDNFGRLETPSRESHLLAAALALSPSARFKVIPPQIGDLFGRLPPYA